MIYPKPIRGEPWEGRMNHLLSSVRAIPLKPGSKVDEILDDVLNDILSEISMISSDEIYFDPSNHHIIWTLLQFGRTRL